MSIAAKVTAAPGAGDVGISAREQVREHGYTAERCYGGSEYAFMAQDGATR